MRLFTVLTVLLFASFSQAQDSQARLDCNSDPTMPSYQLLKKDAETFQLRAYFPRGIEAAPIFSGDISLGDLGALQKRADFVRSLGSNYVIDFPASQCIRQKKDDSLFYIHCYLKTPMQINNVDLQGASFFALGKTTSSLTLSGGRYIVATDANTEVGMDLGVRSALGTHWNTLSRHYTTSECRITEELWK